MPGIGRSQPHTCPRKDASVGFITRPVLVPQSLPPSGAVNSKILNLTEAETKNASLGPAPSGRNTNLPCVYSLPRETPGLHKGCSCFLQTLGIAQPGFLLGE